MLKAIEFVSCGKTENRLFVVERNNLYGYVNQKGDTVIDCRYPLTYTDTISKIGFVADNEGNFFFMYSSMIMDQTIPVRDISG